MLRRLTLSIVVLGLLLPSVSLVSAQSGPSGFRALSGADARAFQLPADVAKLWTARLANGLTQMRYQQTAGAAAVLGGQLTLLRDAAGTITAVIGAHYPAIKATNERKLTAAEAKSVAAARIGNAGLW